MKKRATRTCVPQLPQIDRHLMVCPEPHHKFRKFRNCCNFGMFGLHLSTANDEAIPKIPKLGQFRNVRNPWCASCKLWKFLPEAIVRSMFEQLHRTSRFSRHMPQGSGDRIKLQTSQGVFMCVPHQYSPTQRTATPVPSTENANVFNISFCPLVHDFMWLA